MRLTLIDIKILHEIGLIFTLFKNKYNGCKGCNIPYKTLKGFILWMAILYQHLNISIS